MNQESRNTQRKNPSGAAVSVRNLTKTFAAPDGGVLTAVNGISFEVKRSEIFGFLGPNGAGKTTTLEILEGLGRSDAGEVRVLDLDPQGQAVQLKHRIGIQLQSAAYFEFLTLEEILRLFGSFYSRSVAPAELLDKVGLLTKRKALVRNLSGGQAQRFSIVAALVNDPDVLFLDEPTTGLDPQARRNLWDLIIELNHQQKKTIILTTHYMEEAERLCDRVAILDEGEIKALDTPQDLIQGLPAPCQVQFSSQRLINEAELREIPGVVDAMPSLNGSARYQLAVDDASATLSTLLSWAGERSVALDNLRVLPATLEDVFLSLTGRALRE